MCQSNPYSWFRLNHDITRHPYFRNANLFQFFIYLLDRAAVRDEEGLERGCVRMGIRAYSEEFGVPHRSVRSFIERMVKDGSIEVVSTKQRSGTIIRLVNYDRYQYGGKTGDTHINSHNSTHIDTHNSTHIDTHIEEERRMPMDKGVSSDLEEHPTHINSHNSAHINTHINSHNSTHILARARNTNPRVLEEALEAKEEKEKREINLSQKERKESAAKAAAAEAARETKARFVPPSLSEVEAYALEKGAPEEASTFWNFYESKNWMVGKNKMQKWRNAFSGWLSRRQRNQISNTYRHEATDNTPLSRAEQREAERIQREQGVARLVAFHLEQAKREKQHPELVTGGEIPF